MKLYTDKEGNWVGTQAQAKREMEDHCFDQVDVPTDKPNLLRFLNEHQVMRDASFLEEEREKQPQEQQRSNSRWTAKDLNGFDIRDIAQEASLKDLTFAMSVYLNRIDEELS